MIEAGIYSQTLDQKRILEELVQKSKYPFACWQMPGDREITLIISLNIPEKLTSNLAESRPGFVVNKFSDNHPIVPMLIQADILISRNGEIKKGKNITDIHVSEFLESLSQNNEPISSHQHVNLKEISADQSSTFTNKVSEAIKIIKTSHIDKIVLSRYEDYQINGPFSFSTFFESLTNSYKGAFCNIWSLGDGKVWIGASPETLISQEGPIFKTISLAGTQPLLDQKISDISWKQKEIEEQALVSRYIINCFKKLRVREFEEYGPKTIAAGSLAHLITTYQVNSEEIHFEGFADAMAELLHPTSAVCGMPMEDSMKFISEYEGYDREYYAGFIGPVNMHNVSHLFVNLRCLKIENSIVRIYAGAGITEDSDPEKEYFETALKMDILKSKLQ